MNRYSFVRTQLLKLRKCCIKRREIKSRQSYKVHKKELYKKGVLKSEGNYE